MSSAPRQRLRSHRLVGSSFTSARQVVSWLGALQGQDLASATWSIGLRLPGSTEADVERAFTKGELVRTWVMRGTLHVVAAEDVRWMLELTRDGNVRRAAGRHRELGLDEQTLARSRDVLAKALIGAHLTREELFAALERVRLSTEENRGYHLLWDAAVQGLICSGAPRGKEQTFTLLDAWIPAAKPRSREEALAELARRYFQSRAPATLKDFAWWAALSQREARSGFEASALEGSTLTPTLSQRERETGVRSLSRGERETGVRSLSRGERETGFALPAFDEYLLGYQDRSAVLDPRHAKRIFPGGGTFLPSLVLDGKVVGCWRRASLELETFTRVKRKPLEDAVQRYAQFISPRGPPSRRGRSAD